MSDKIRLEIVTPYGTVYGEDVDEVGAPGSEGDFGVFPGHAPFLTTLRIGELFARVGNVTDFFFVNGGFAEVGPDKVIVLTDSAEHAPAIDVQRAIEARKRAEERLAKQADIDLSRAQVALERAIHRLSLAEKYKK